MFVVYQMYMKFVLYMLVWNNNPSWGIQEALLLQVSSDQQMLYQYIGLFEQKSLLTVKHVAQNNTGMWNKNDHDTPLK